MAKRKNQDIAGTTPKKAKATTEGESTSTLFHALRARWGEDGGGASGVSLAKADEMGK